MVEFTIYVENKTNRNRSGKPRQFVIALIDGKIVGRFSRSCLTVQQVVDFVNRDFTPKSCLDASIPTWML